MLDYSQLKSVNELNWYEDDPILTRYAKRYLPESVLTYVEDSFRKTGQLAAGPMDRRAVYTDRDGAPKLIRYNKKGEEINEVWYNEGYLQTVRDGYGTGVVAYRYDANAPSRIPFFVNAILLYLLCEAEPGFTCPVGLTQSAAFVLEKFGSDQQKEMYLSRLASLDHEWFVQGATFLTEIQGGSDVGAIKTVAVVEGDHYRLTGEKWFASNCDAEVAIVLARVNDLPDTRGLGLFLVPRTLPDGTHNRVTIRRLKDKLGVRAVASGELVFEEAIGYLIGEETKGFKYMAEALNVSRLGTALSGLASARRALSEAALYTSQRAAFGQNVMQFPMVRETLSDLAVEIEAGWAIVAQTIKRFDEVHTYERDQNKSVHLLRILLSLVKLHCSELGVTSTRQAMELHGGNGYIEEYVTARLLRDALVNPIWEGTANIQALEVLKNLQKGGAVEFLGDLENTLQLLHLSGTERLRDTLRTELMRCEKLMGHVLQQAYEVQSAMAKRLALFMYEVFAAIHLLEEAQYDMIHFHDKRRLLVTESWVNKSFSMDANRDILNNRLVTENDLQVFVAFKSIPLEDLT